MDRMAEVGAKIPRLGGYGKMVNVHTGHMPYMDVYCDEVWNRPSGPGGSVLKQDSSLVAARFLHSQPR